MRKGREGGIISLFSSKKKKKKDTVRRVICTQKKKLKKKKDTVGKSLEISVLENLVDVRLLIFQTQSCCFLLCTILLYVKVLLFCKINLGCGGSALHLLSVGQWYLSMVLMLH
jgi:hypothetical protein